VTRSVPDRVAFRRHDVGALERAVASVLTQPGAWINVEPDLEDVDPRAVRRPGIFSSRGRAVPLSTLVVGEGGRPHQLGVEHGSGRDAVERLRDAGVTVPDGTRVVSDHPRRGLVLNIPNGTSAAALAALLVATVAQLTVVPLGDRWIAQVYRN
jgi:hypothetical protein